MADIPLTAARAAVGVGLALLLGIGSGLLAGYWKTLGLFCRPLISMLLGMPPIVWLVLALFWFGMGTGGVVFTITVTTLPLTFAAAMRGMLTMMPGCRKCCGLTKCRGRGGSNICICRIC